MSGGSEKTVYHEVEWTAETIQRYWDFVAANSAGEDSYFSKKFARRIVGMARRHGRLLDPVVDMGCGLGFLTEELLRRGQRVTAIDSSASSVERVRERLGSGDGRLDTRVGELERIPVEDGAAGSLFLIEVLEHLPPEGRDRVASEVARVVRPGGCLVLTTPNEEDLDAKKVACPECGCVFHRVQHMQRMDAETLQKLLDRHGFEPVFVSGLNFRHFPDLPIGSLIAGAASRFAGLGGGGGAPHLLVIGRRRER